ncbi:hypothetical protein OIU78_019548 [Salix suchowensis]|nr:hypothetical protein OIU78_019548 [Salix suchowensis]
MSDSRVVGVKFNAFSNIFEVELCLLSEVDKIFGLMLYGWGSCCERELQRRSDRVRPVVGSSEVGPQLKSSQSGGCDRVMPIHEVKRGTYHALNHQLTAEPTADIVRHNDLNGLSRV